MSDSIVMCGCFEVGWEIIRRLLEEGVEIDYFVTLNPDQATRWDVAGYRSFTDLAEQHDVPVRIVESYGLDHPSDREFETRPQSGEESYYPKRSPEDGRIDWSKSVFAIHDLVRGVTRPYPGAFSFLGEEKVFFWRVQPSDTRITNSDARAGEIAECFHTGEFVVKCYSGLLLVRDYEAENGSVRLEAGRTFSSRPSSS